MSNSIYHLRDFWKSVIYFFATKMRKENLEWKRKRRMVENEYFFLSEREDSKIGWMPDQVKRGRGTEKKTLLLELSAMILQSCPLAIYRLWTLEACHT